MLAFVTSLRHPHNSANYDRVEELLADTVSSVQRQDTTDFSLWVVGNQRPRSLPSSVNWVEVGFPPPSDHAGPITGEPAVILDKGTKLAVGVAAARQSQPDHIMLMDADDLVSRRLASLSASAPTAPGWKITNGWRWASERTAIRRQVDFHLHCGTGYIVRTDLLDVPEELSAQSPQEEIVDILGDRVRTYFGSHLHLSDQLLMRGFSLDPVPFAAALYRVGTGENHSGISLGGLGRPTTQSVSQEFGVPQTAATPVGLLRAVLPGRRAFTERLRRGLR